ncbi:hypothetical protein ACTFIW_010831 [Dictyostelium discoideum]
MISKIIIIIFIVINFINIIISSITFDIDCRDIINGGINPSSSSSSSNSNSGSDYSGEIILNLKNKECKDYHIEELLNNYYIQNNSMITINGNETFGTTIIQSKKQPFLNLINNNNSNNNNNNNSNNSTTTKSLISLNITINNINFNNWITPILYMETINNNINFINTNFNNHSNEILISYPIISNNNNDDDNSINKTLNSINLNNCKFENFNYLTKLNNLIMPIKLKQTSISVKTSTFINLSMNNTFFHLNQSSLTISNCSTNNITTNNFSFITLINSPTIISNYNHSNSNGSFINHINNNNDPIDFNNEIMLIEFSNFNNNLILPQPQPQLELLEQRLQQLNNSDNNNNNNNNSFNENINGFIILDCENKTEKANVLFYSNQFINIIPYNINFNYSIINIKNINLILNNNNIINNINSNSNSNNNSGIISKANFNNQNLINIVNSNLTLINSTIESDNPIGGEYSTVYIDSPSNDKIGWNKSNNTNSSSSSDDSNSNSSSSGGGDNNSNGSSGNNKSKNKNNKLEWCFDCDGCVFSISTDKNVTLTNSDICPDPDAPNNSNDNGNGNGNGGGGSGKKSYKNTILAVTISAIGIICVALLLTVVILKRRNRKSSFDYLLINQYYLDDEEEKRELLLNRNNNYYYDNNIIDN